MAANRFGGGQSSTKTLSVFYFFFLLRFSVEIVVGSGGRIFGRPVRRSSGRFLALLAAGQSRPLVRHSFRHFPVSSLPPADAQSVQQVKKTNQPGGVSTVE